jgi:hypothetical protein
MGRSRTYNHLVELIIDVSLSVSGLGYLALSHVDSSVYTAGCRRRRRRVVDTSVDIQNSLNTTYLQHIVWVKERLWESVCMASPQSDHPSGPVRGTNEMPPKQQSLPDSGT